VEAEALMCCVLDQKLIDSAEDSTHSLQSQRADWMMATS
jgi:hypothetical protein